MFAVVAMVDHRLQPLDFFLSLLSLQFLCLCIDVLFVYQCVYFPWFDLLQGCVRVLYSKGSFILGVARLVLPAE